MQVEHYVISSGMKEIIEGTEISKNFKSIFACEFLYDENGNAVWPKTDVNYTNKTQFVYRINKGVLDVANDVDLNRSMPEDSKRVPFCNMIYIGDGLSDVPCMKMMKAYGGYSIAVYRKKDSKVEDLLRKTELILSILPTIRKTQVLTSPLKISSEKWLSAVFCMMKTMSRKKKFWKIISVE